MVLTYRIQSINFCDNEREPIGTTYTASHPSLGDANMNEPPPFPWLEKVLKYLLQEAYAEYGSIQEAPLFGARDC